MSYSDREAGGRSPASSTGTDSEDERRVSSKQVDPRKRHLQKVATKAESEVKDQSANKHRDNHSSSDSSSISDSSESDDEGKREKEEKERKGEERADDRTLDQERKTQPDSHRARSRSRSKSGSGSDHDSDSQGSRSDDVAPTQREQKSRSALLFSDDDDSESEEEVKRKREKGPVEKDSEDDAHSPIPKMAKKDDDNLFGSDSDIDKSHHSDGGMSDDSQPITIKRKEDTNDNDDLFGSGSEGEDIGALDDAEAYDKEAGGFGRAKRERKEKATNVELPYYEPLLDGNGVKAPPLLKLPNMFSIQSEPFDPLTYKETDEQFMQDEEGRERIKMGADNTIRWRYAKDENGNTIKESNTKIIRWDDGTMSMFLGNECFDIKVKDCSGENTHLYSKASNILYAQGVFRERYLFNLADVKNSTTHRKMTEINNQRFAKNVKVKSTVMEMDPQKYASEMAKREDERIQARAKLKAKQRNMDMNKRRIDRQYLEHDYDSEGDGDDRFDKSIDAIKRSIKNKSKDQSTSESESDHDSEAEMRLARLKRNQPSPPDDSDPNVDDDLDRRTKYAQKKNQRLQESDSDSN